ncbi:MAG: hypothetical protein AB7V50_04040 [Vampirovibrionia bacterium]
MSLISNLIAQNRAVASRISGNAAAFSGRDQLLSGSSSAGGSLKQLQHDEVSFTSQIHQGNFNAKYAGKWEESARQKMKKDIQSTFSTFA